VHNSRPHIVPTNRNPAQGSFGGVIGQTDPTILDELRERWPAPQHVIHRLRHGSVARQFAAFASHPALEIRDERNDVFLPHSETTFGGQTIDGALGVENDVDPTHRLNAIGALPSSWSLQPEITRHSTRKTSPVWWSCARGAIEYPENIGAQYFST
jgi:hypothetical protein